MLPLRFGSIASALVLTLGLVSTGALADQPSRQGRDHTTGERTAAHARVSARHHHHLVGHDLASPAGPHAGPVRPETGWPGYAGPGYVFVPGEGILGEDCNMPTSTCPNEVRDVQ